MPTNTQAAPAAQEQDASMLIPGRMSYLHVFEATSIKPNQPKKFSVSVIIPKSDTKTIELIKKKIEVATQIGLTKLWNGKLPTREFRYPLRDGDVERAGDPAYKDSMFINCNSPANARPSVVDRNLQPIIDPDVFYSGCYGRVSVNFFPFNNVGNGIGAGLGNLQKLRDGDPLTNRTTAEQDFADAPIEDDPNEL